eukprot:CAMPEP_0206493784 /NCGR_PEP_ID=MMETSP0324_2-20121206/47250_1 /ASSEMBLY_ACC=CAM_ASM_000836 /TAXON_ID=2866 /ORGANISM="Crypthecodinium cohnii, Strain Seligo" /LENGTH=69 /DNA_ID=CAMNT_0053977137 /DNA_START=79 /DNA_END=288 /DNA_ORIENTATION=-
MRSTTHSAEGHSVVALPEYDHDGAGMALYPPPEVHRSKYLGPGWRRFALDGLKLVEEPLLKGLRIGNQF